MKAIVTGSSGYIGGQCVLHLRDAGHTVLGIDYAPPPIHLRGMCHSTLTADFANDATLNWIVENRPDAVIHCAGTSLVGPSMTNPALYFNNNVVKTLRLLDCMRSQLPQTRFIFSSSAATYGIPFMNPCHEVDPCEPISAYGQSKLMTEQVLHWYHKAYGFDYVAFRFFNACGADHRGRHGQAPGATHIIAQVLESIRDNREFVLNGNDYPTDDGSCVRDYVHVSDIAKAHVLALSSAVPSGIYNLGTSTGTSNKQIIGIAQEITGVAVRVKEGPKRDGDPAVLTADPAKFNRLVDWQQYSLRDVIQHAWNWYVR